MVAWQLPKLLVRVRFPLPAPARPAAASRVRYWGRGDVARTIDGEAFDRLFAQHLSWVLSAGKSGVRADFDGAALDGANLHAHTLDGAVFARAALRRAELRRARLRGADFSGADLTDALLHDADLTGADLRGADLSGSEMIRADLTDADLRGARLDGACLRGAILLRTRLESSAAAAAAIDLVPSQLRQARVDERDTAA